MRIKLTVFTAYMTALAAAVLSREAQSGSFWELLLFAAFFGVIHAAGRTDLKSGRLPDRYAVCAVLLGICGLLFSCGPSLSARLEGCIAVSLPLLVICLLWPGAFGGGDVKLMAACGFFLGEEAVRFSFAYAVLAGGGWAFLLLLTGRAGRRARFPFGPFLCAGMALAALLRFP